MNKWLELAENGQQLYVLKEHVAFSVTLFSKSELVAFVKRPERPAYRPDRLALAKALKDKYKKLVWHHKPSVLLAYADSVINSPFYSHKNKLEMAQSSFYEHLVYRGCSTEELTDDEALAIVDEASSAD
jgi:hypothetical protein